MTSSPLVAAAKTTAISTFLDLGDDEGRRRSSRSYRALLSRPYDDPEHLSDLLCFVRCQIEAFVISSDEEIRRYRGAFSKSRGRGAGSSNADFAGCVGIRCVHCANSADGFQQTPPQSGRPSTKMTDPKKQNGRRKYRLKRSPGATSYPQSVRLVYQSVRNWQRYHALTCRSMPPEVRAKYVALKAAGRGERSSMDSFKYWEESCRRMGMIDDEEGGIRLRDGFFIVDGSSGNEGSEFGTDSGGCNGNADEGGGVRGDHLDSDVRTGRAAVKLMDAVTLDTECSHKHSPARSTPVSIPSSNRAEGVQTKGTTGFVQHSRNDLIFDRTKFDAVSNNLWNEKESDDICFSPPADPQVDDLPAAELASCAALEQAPARRCDALNSEGEMSGTVLNNLQSEGEIDKLCISPFLSANIEGDGTLIARLSSGPLLTDDDDSDPSLAELVCSPIVDLEEQDDAIASNEVVLERIWLASMMVQAMGQVSPLEGGEKKREGMKVEDLRYIGEELYGLFSGRSLRKGLDLDEAGDGEEEEKVLERGSGKQEKRHRIAAETAVDGTYVPLVELGLPPALCRLVSSLLHRCVGDGHVEYGSIAQVEEDLRLMAGEPERYLFCATTGELRMDDIYGREGEISALLEAYGRATTVGAGRMNEMVLVSGYTGTGKSTLVHSARDLLVSSGACFVSGKFDAMRQLRPMSAIISALDNYYCLLARDEARIDAVRGAALAAMGSEGMSVLASLIPSLRRIFSISGSDWCVSPPHIHLGGRETLQRLQYLFRILLRATCARAHPLVLFLDDLQWADEMSLELMQVLVVDVDIQGMLFVGSYRDNEVGADHPLAMHLENIRQERTANITSIQVSYLCFDSVNSLVSDALYATPRTARSLSECVMHKTGGNALFVVQFLSSLCDENLLRFALVSRRWEWDLDGIRRKDVADNVAELMTAKLLKLTPEVQQALSTAAAFGAQCHDDIIAILDRAQDSVIMINDALDVAASEGLVIKTESACRFSHDQIQHAAYQLVPEPDRESFHLRVGRSLWRWSSTEEMSDFLFILVDQLHRGSRLIVDPDEKVNLARLSLMAGKRSFEMSAFLPASAFLKAGIDLLVESDWDCHRGLCLDLYNSYAEIDYILGDFDKLKDTLGTVFSRARALKEKLRAYYTLAKSTFAQNNASDAIDVTLAVLGQLGEPFPESVSESLVKQELMMTQKVVSEQTEDTLLHLETMRDGEKQEAMKFFGETILYVYLEKKEYFPLVACRMVRLSLSHGVCKESAKGFACYGILLIGILGDLSGGYRYGNVAVSVLERFRVKDHLAQVYLPVYGAINNWVEPIQSSLPFLKESIDAGLAAGDIVYAMMSALGYSTTAMCSGQPLDPLIEEMKLRSKQMVEYEQHHADTASKPLRQTILNLLGRSANPIKLIGEEMDEETVLSNAEDGGADARNNVLLYQTYFYRMYLEYLFGEYDLAWETAQKNRDIAKYSLGRFPFVCGYTFISGLVAIALARRHGKAKYADTIDGAIEQMGKWASSTQWNCQHKLDLLTAEYLYLEEHTLDAAKAYDSAVVNAAKHSFIHEEALALERFGLFYLENGVPGSASAFFKKAHDCYTKWGARAKAAHVQELYM